MLELSMLTLLILAITIVVFIMFLKQWHLTMCQKYRQLKYTEGRTSAMEYIAKIGTSRHFALGARRQKLSKKCSKRYLLLEGIYCCHILHMMRQKNLIQE